MKITKKICQSVKIYNEYEYAKDYPYLFYKPAERDGLYISAAWGIAQKSKSFSDFWRDYGVKYFSVTSRDKKEKEFQAAVKWMCETFNYNPEDIVKTPFGNYMHKDFIASRNREIEIMYKANLVLENIMS